MTLTIFRCDALRSRLSPAQCAHLWRRANGPASVTGKGQHVRMPRRECVGCEIGAAHARGSIAPDVELIPATALIASPDTTPAPTPTPTPVTTEPPETSMPTTPTIPTFSDEQKADAVRRIAAGERVSAIAGELGCSDSAIYQWRDRIRGRAKSVREVAREKAAQKAARTAAPKPAPKKPAPPEEKGAPRSPPAAPRPYTVASPSRVAHEDVIAFLARLPPIPWALGDAIRLLAFHAIDGDFDDVVQARARIDAHLRARGEAA